MFPGSQHGRKLDISHDPCSINDEPGTCMFNSECFKRKGIVLGACRDGFLFGACCAINPNASSVVLDDMEEEEDTAGSVLDKIDELLDTLKAGLSYEHCRNRKGSTILHSTERENLGGQSNIFAACKT